MNNRGISPLIATIFLIAVAVALGSVVMSLGQEYVTTSSGVASVESCVNIDFEVKTIEIKDNALLFSIDNKGQEIDGFIVKVFSEDFKSAVSTQILEVTKEYDVGVYYMTEDQLSNVVPYEISLTPVELESGDIVPCPEKVQKIVKGMSSFQ